MADCRKPLPIADSDSKPYWDAAKAHELRAQQCASCGAFRWPPRGVCPSCHSWQFRWVELPGTGTIASYIVAIHPVAAFASDVPYVIGRITLDGTDRLVTITSNVVDCPWEQVKVGMRVRVFFDDVTPDVTLPKFKPID
jgi:uncharacterized OB-fold protein